MPGQPDLSHVTPRRRIIMSAYACEPEKGSDPGVGWNQVEQISRFHDVWVITRKNNEASIRRHAASLRGVHWVFFDLPPWAAFWKRGRRGIHLYYYLWQIGAYRRAKRLNERIRFDLAHHVTFVNYWMPSLFSLLPVPFLWGPVGGGENASLSLWWTFSPRGWVFELGRAAARWIGEHDPLVRYCARRARIALATTPETAARLKRLGCRDVRLLGESGIRRDELLALGSYPYRADAAPRFVSLGRLVHLKGYHLGIRAFARMRSRIPGSTYWLLGDGPERGRLEALAGRLGVQDAVRFWGCVHRRAALEILSQCDVLVHPSLHDSGGWVCVEAMAAGRPVICFDIGGPATQVSPDTGIIVPARERGKAVAGLAEAMERFARDKALLAEMGNAARRRVVEFFSWSVKGDIMRLLYAVAMGGK